MLHEGPEAEADEAAEHGQVAAGHRAAGPESSWAYRYDPTRPEADAARQLIDDILQEAAGRTNPGRPTDVHVTEPGSRYIDFLIPGLIGLNAMGGGLWGIGFFLVNLRIGKLLKWFVATPMPRRDFLLAILASRLTFLIPDVTMLLLLGTLVFHMPIRGNLLLVFAHRRPRRARLRGDRPAGRQPGHHDRDGQRAHEPGHAADVPLLRASSSPPSGSPPAVQPLIQALPLTQFVSALRLVILDGAGLVDVGPALLSWPPGPSAPSPWPCASSAGPETAANRGLRST